MIKRILLSSGAMVASVALSGGIALAATGSISNTGDKSVNVISSVVLKSCTNVNNNNTGVNTWTTQQAATGNASVTKNTVSGGNAKTGPAANNNATGLIVGVSNTSACPTAKTVGVQGVSSAPSIDTTGDKSLNVISSFKVSSVTVVNNNNTWVNTATLQGAQSGNATVSGNTLGGGDATSGGSTNTNDTTVSLTVTND